MSDIFEDLLRSITYVIYNSEKDYKLLRKGLVQTISWARLLFRFSDKKQDRLSVCNKKQGIYIGKLDAWVYCHCWEHWRTISCKVIKILYLSVLNDDTTVVHQICKYKYFHHCYIHWSYSYFHLNIGNNNEKQLTGLNGPFSQKSLVFFTLWNSV